MKTCQYFINGSGEDKYTNRWRVVETHPIAIYAISGDDAGRKKHPGELVTHTGRKILSIPLQYTYKEKKYFIGI